MRLDALVLRMWQWRGRLALLGLLLFALCAAGLAQLRDENNYKQFFDADDPQLVAHEAMEEAYTRSDSTSILFGSRDGSTLLTPRYLELIEELTARMWQFPRALRVDSITNFQHSQGVGDDLQVAPLFNDAASLSPAELERRRAVALSEPALVNALIAPDGSATAIRTRLNMPTEDLDEAAAATIDTVKRMRALQAELREDYPELEWHVLGLPQVDYAFKESMDRDMRELVPLMFAVICLLCWFLMRSLAAVGAVVLVIVATVPASLGLAGWVGLPLNEVSGASPVIILTLCVCDAVHVLVSQLKARAAGLEREAAAQRALRLNLAPVFLTTLTTAVGFVSLNFSDAPPFRDLGNITAIGVVLAWAFSLLLLPWVMGLLPAPSKPVRELGLGRLAGVVIRQRRPLFWGLLLAALVIIGFSPRNVLTDSTYQYFNPGTPIRDAADFVEERLTGFDNINYSLPAAGAGGISDPEYLRQVEAFAQWYRQQRYVVHVAAITDTFKKLNRNMHGEDPQWYRVPENPELAAQYLLLYEFSLPFGLDLNTQVNFDKSATKFVVTLRGVKAKQIQETQAAADAWLRANAPAIHAPGTGVSAMFAAIGQNNIRSMLVGSIIALLGISLTLMVALRSWRVGLISLVPNAIPALMSFGIWGLLVAEVNLAVAAIFSITLGIVVDDTVHFLSKYLRARRDEGADAAQAVRHAFDTVGAALLVTTLALTAGFGILALSDFQVNALTGLLTAITISIALFYDLLFLPPLLMRLDRWLLPARTAGAAGSEQPAAAGPGAGTAAGLPPQ